MPTDRDRDMLRSLGERIARIGRSREMDEKRRLWKRLNALDAERPMVMVETSGVEDEEMSLERMECQGEWARGVERRLRIKLFQAEEIRDDSIIEPWITYRSAVQSSDYGVTVEKHRSADGDTRGSYIVKAPITDIGEGLKKLRFRTHSVDRDATELQRARLEYTFSGVLAVEKRGMYWWTNGLTVDIIELIGLDGLMLAMYDQPEELRALMAFLRDDRMAFLDWHEAQGHLYPNNRDDYTGSGGCGYTDALPKPERKNAAAWGLADMWGLSESQETVSVSPEMFEDFVFRYQKPIIERFGFACYGCCEPVDLRWHIIKNLSNLRRVSVSPWADQRGMADKLGRNYVFSRKPNPTNISMEAWDEELIRKDLKQTMDIAGKLNLEIVMKDVHTVASQPWRLGRWTELARAAIQ